MKTKTETARATRKAARERRESKTAPSLPHVQAVPFSLSTLRRRAFKAVYAVYYIDNASNSHEIRRTANRDEAEHALDSAKRLEGPADINGEHIDAVRLVSYLEWNLLPCVPGPNGEPVTVTFDSAEFVDSRDILETYHF